MCKKYKIIRRHSKGGQYCADSAVTIGSISDHIVQSTGTGEYPNEHLNGLQGCDDFGDKLWDRILEYFEAVIEVHNGMYHVVESNTPPAYGRQITVDEEAVDESDHVVRPMQTNEFLFS